MTEGAHCGRDSLSLSERALTATEIVSQLSKLEGWSLHGDGENLQIEKSITFAGFSEAIAFVNAVAFVADRGNHHPYVVIDGPRCILRFHTHDIQGLSSLDFQAARRVDELLA